MEQSLHMARYDPKCKGSLSELLGDFKELLYLSVTTRTVIGQFSGPYSTLRPSKI